MTVTVAIDIDGSRESIWSAITDIENCQQMISSILKIDILNTPTDGVVGLKWVETREMFGKEATETMWITDATPNEHYSTRAESHGSVYTTRLDLKDAEKGTLLTMSFTGTAQTVAAKLLSFLMGPLIKKSMITALNKDLEDIKAFVEKN